LSLDEAPFKYMERAYHKATGQSLVDKFGEQIKEVTIRQLLSMRGSIADYDEFGYQHLHPAEDLGPSTSAQMFGTSINGLPLGTCGVYSSMSYVLIGLMLIGIEGVAWDKYDQNVWKEHFPRIKFSQHGTCGQYTDVDGHCGQCSRANPPVDVLDWSCTNGFTCGNLVGPPEEVSRFVWALFRGKLLKKETVAQMQTYTPLGVQGATRNQTCGGWCSGCLYGLGLQAPANSVDVPGQPVENFPGHAGQTYGYTSISAFDHWHGAAYVAGVAADEMGAGAVWKSLRNAVGSDPEMDWLI